MPVSRYRLALHSKTQMSVLWLSVRPTQLSLLEDIILTKPGFSIVVDAIAVVSRINFTHITISVHKPKSSLVATCTRRRYMVHRNRDSYEV